MKPFDIFLAIMVALVWGMSFVAAREGLESFTAAQLTALRFATASLGILILPRPRIAWRYILAVGGLWFLMQFMLLFFALYFGMPPGLASVTQQSNVFMTILLAAILFREKPTSRQMIGLCVALAGLMLIGLSTGADLPLIAFLLTLAAALSWALGNTVVKHMPNVSMVPFAAWASLVAPLPSLALSWWLGEGSVVVAIQNASMISIIAVIYLGTLATLGGYAMWGHLLGRYPAATVTPFALLVPVTGIIASVVLYGEAFPPQRALGIALVMLGLATIVLRAKKAPTEVPPL